MMIMMQKVSKDEGRLRWDLPTFLEMAARKVGASRRHTKASHELGVRFIVPHRVDGGRLLDRLLSFMPHP